MSARQALAIVPGFAADRSAFVWRGLGQVADLDLDFLSNDRPALVTAVLAACAEPPVGDRGQEAIWRLSLAARIGGLLAIQAATTRADILLHRVHCPNQDCGEEMEVSLPVAELLALGQAAEEQPEITVQTPGSSFRLHRPRGTDQRRWREQEYPSSAAAEAALLHSLVIEGAPTAKVSEALAEALATFDPLSCFELDVTCPSCGRQSDISIDLEAVLLAELARTQAAMIRDVDGLARRYGWSEAEVLAVPAWRRRRYRALSESDGWPA